MARLLVYGSLRQGQKANDVLRDCEYDGQVRVPGYDLFALTWFPGIVPNPENKEGFIGELYNLPEDEKIRNELITYLDYYEGHFPDNKEKSLYRREEVEVEGKPTIVYIFNFNPYDAFGTSARVVPSGDWNQYKGEDARAA